MSKIKVTDAMIEAYRLAKDEAAGWCGCYDSDENRHYIVKGNEIVWEMVSEDYTGVTSHSAMMAELRRMRDVHALSAALAHPGQVREIAIKPLTWRGDFAHTEFGLFYHITERGADLCCVLEKHAGSSEMKSFWQSVEEAKAAAQQDYSARVLSALSVQEPKRWLLEEHLPGGSIRWHTFEHERQCRARGAASEHRVTVSPLYLSPSPSIPEEKGGTAESVLCPCTTFEQDEDCPVGYPSMLCSACAGTGNAPMDKVVALAAEMMKVAEQVGELEDPFAAWESIDLIKSQMAKASAAKREDWLDVEDIREKKLATICAPDNGTPQEVLSAVLECANAWVPEARIIGNVRAGDIARAIEALKGGTAESELVKAARAVEQWWLAEGMRSFNGAPYAMFALRAALAPQSEGSTDE